MDVKTYTVVAKPDHRYWFLRFPALDQVTQARNIKEIPRMAKDLIHIMTDETEFDIEVVYDLPVAAEQHRQRAVSLRAQELHVRNEAAQELRAAARTLRNEGLTLRDVGALLGVSTQRAGQLLSQ